MVQEANTVKLTHRHLAQWPEDGRLETPLLPGLQIELASVFAPR